MTTTPHDDGNDLTEKIARAAFDHDEAEMHPNPRSWEDATRERQLEYLTLADALLPLIAAEVKRGKAEALREAAEGLGQQADDLYVYMGSGKEEEPWWEGTVLDYLLLRADEIDQEDHR